MRKPFDNPLADIHYGLQNIPSWLNECRFVLSCDGLEIENPAFFAYFGLHHPLNDFEPWIDRTHPEDRARLDALLNPDNAIDELWQVLSQYRVKNQHNQYTEVEQKLALVDNEQGQLIIGRLSIIESPQQQNLWHSESSLRHPLSGLFTRSKLLIDIANIQRIEHKKFTLAHIKIDSLANYVRQFGPELLLDVARQLRRSGKVFDSLEVQLYHLDTDTFVLLLVGPIENKLLQPLFENFLAHYLSLNEGKGSLYADKLSVGIVPNNLDQLSAQQLLEISTQTRRYAYSLKHTNLAIYNEATKQSVERYSYIEQNLSRAIKQDQLSVKFHPIVKTETNHVESFETLVRWNSDIYGEIGPYEFIHIAEKQGLIWDLGLVVFSKACQFIKQYNQTYQTDTHINVNVSVLQLLHRDLPSHFRRIALKHAVKPSSIVIELTETVILDDDNQALEQLKALAKMGFVLSLDDFGAGMSSFNSFFDFPFSQIKIDRMFAIRALKDTTPSQFLQFLIDLCRRSQISIVVEGVEDQTMLDYYKQLGSTHLQGYFYTQPMAESEALNFMPERT